MHAVMNIMFEIQSLESYLLVFSGRALMHWGGSLVYNSLVFVMFRKWCSNSSLCIKDLFTGFRYKYPYWLPFWKELKEWKRRNSRSVTVVSGSHRSNQGAWTNRVPKRWTGENGYSPWAQEALSAQVTINYEPDQ